MYSDPIESIHERKKSFNCICDSNFSKKQHLNRHIESVHERKKPFKCNHCGKAFSRKANLNGHIEKVHEEKKKNQIM